MNSAELPGFLVTGISSGLLIGFVGIGGLLSDMAGSLTLALEGSMLLGAYGAIHAFMISGSLGLALLVATLAGASAGLVVGWAATRLRADVFVAGLAVNLLSPALLSLLSEKSFGTKGILALPQGLAMGAAAAEPVIFTLLCLGIVGFWLMVDATPLGNRLRAAGEVGEAARAAGLDRDGLRLLAHILAGAAAGYAGAFLALSIAAFVPGMSAGRGWMALVAIFLGGRKPLGTLVASLSFGFLLSIANLAQGTSWLPPELLPTLPYLITGIVYVASRKSVSAS